MGVYSKKPDTQVNVGKHTVNIYKGKGSTTYTIGKITGKQNGGNFGGKTTKTK